MSDDPGRVVPYRFDLPTLVPRSVATLYNKHLVTRPTGHALRLGIESQIAELGPLCLSVLDFTQVVVLDYSCADEIVAKLLLRYLGQDRPTDAYFVARGIGEHHVETLETVLERHGLALVGEMNGAGAVLLGELGDLQRAVWSALERLGRAGAAEVAAAVGVAEDDVGAALVRLAAQRVVLGSDATGRYGSLSALLRAG